MKTIFVVLLAIGILGFLWSRLRNHPKVEVFVRKYIADWHDYYQDPRCFNCNRGSCVEPSMCQIIIEESFTMEGGSPDGR